MQQCIKTCNFGFETFSEMYKSDKYKMAKFVTFYFAHQTLSLQIAHFDHIYRYYKYGI